jgi:WD40 repeat protein
VDSVASSPDGKALATGDSDSNTYLWDVAEAGSLPDAKSLGAFVTFP